MQKEQCFYVGKIAKKFSFKGEVLLYLDTDDLSDYENLESVLVDFHGTLVPFLIERKQWHKGQFLRVKFDEVDTEAQADEIVGREVYLPLEFLPELEEGQFYYHEIVGFQVQDAKHGNIGTVLGVNDSGIQPLLVIRFQEKEILIPLLDEFIQQLDKPNQTLYLKTPPGMMELYL